MSLYYIIYHGLLFIAFVLTVWSFIKGRKQSFIAALLLFLTLFVELVAEYLSSQQINFLWIYHLYVPFEYTLFTLYYIKTDSSEKKWPVLFTIPLFCLFSFSLSYFHYHLSVFPSMNINTEGILLFIMYTHLLFNLKINKDFSLIRIGDFWLSLGVLFFFGGIFVFNGLFGVVFNLDKQKAIELFVIINRPLNLLFYSLISLGAICWTRSKSYSIR